eukprot:14530152-Alexandrium_andersonii.AAC.1
MREATTASPRSEAGWLIVPPAAARQSKGPGARSGPGVGGLRGRRRQAKPSCPSQETEAAG